MPRFATVVLSFALLTGYSPAAEVATLDPSNYDQLVPAGKEVDAIYGDHVLRSDKLVAIVAEAVSTRNANMTVKGVGGSLIDLTSRDEPSDQLSCFYPHGGGWVFEGPVDWPDELPSKRGAAKLAFRLKPRNDAATGERALGIVVGYELADGDDYLTVRSLMTNSSDEAIALDLADGIRADGEFGFGVSGPANAWWCHDDYWQQAYAVAVMTRGWTTREGDPQRRRPGQIFYGWKDMPVKLAGGGSFVLARRIYPGKNSFDVLARAARARGQALTPVSVEVTDGRSPIEGALVKAVAGEKVVASGRTSSEGRLRARMPAGEYRWVVESISRKNQDTTIALAGTDRVKLAIELPRTGRVAGRVTDQSGDGVPCRLAFYGQGVENPHWGPDSAVHGVRNLWHTHDGEFDVEMLPGEYKMVISRGPEYDAVIKTISVSAGQTNRVRERLKRVVNTNGWISAEMHSHSSPSGDNTSSQRGRVLNLLVDHLEFIPCTEHQRIDAYDEHLKHFGAEHRVLTCTGMELTGSPLPLNHQNVFPLVQKPRTQDGGAPTTHPDPEFQIERIAMWDDGADKVVQINHPNLAQMVGDRDLNGEPDRGFRKMFHFADVIEVHPPEMIYAKPDVGQGGWDGRGNVIFNWMQLLNQGYRVPGVVNTDAHWNYYGSGWLRNYVKCSTDNPGEANLAEVCHALEKGQVVMTNGPFLEVTATAGGETAGPGDDLVSKNNKPKLSVRVECPNWLDVNRVQVFVNGRPDPKLNFLRSASDKFGDGVIKFEHAFDVPLEEDAHLIVAASAEGRELGIVYGEQQGKAMPIAVSNPIFVDIDGGGFEPNRDKLDAPLPVEAGHKATHGHDHAGVSAGG